MIGRIVLAFAVVFCPGAGFASEEPKNAFGPSPQASVESRLDALEIAVAALDVRVAEVEAIANEENIRRIVEELVSTELTLRVEGSEANKIRTVSYAGVGSCELRPGESLVAVDGVPVADPQVTGTYQGVPSVAYTRAGYQYRIQQPGNLRVRRRMWIRRIPRRQVTRSVGRSVTRGRVITRGAVSSGSCANGQCTP